MFKIKNNKSTKPAFTLIELLVVIAIIGILSTLAVVSLQNARKNARDAKRIADVRQMQTALELYYNDTGVYPLTGEIDTAIATGGSTYMARVPLAPTPADGDCEESDNAYTYTSADGSTYTIGFCVGGNISDLSAGLKIASPNGISTPQCGGYNVSFTYNGSPVTYGTALNPVTGECWLDRNLGASQVAISSTDTNAYGDLFQWGRLDDGHQIRTSATTATLATSDTPGHANFIISAADPYDWRNPSNNNLWQGLDGINNPCPDSFRIPTEAEWTAEMATWSSSDSAGAFASSLKLTLNGNRGFGGSLYNAGLYGYYWSSNIESGYARLFFFGGVEAYAGTNARASGYAVRCIKN